MKRDSNLIPSNVDEMCNHYFVGQDSPAAQILRSIVKYGTPEEMADLLQAAALRAIEHDILGKFDPSKSNFGGIVFTVCRSVAANHLSRKSRRPTEGLCAGSITDTDKEFEVGSYQLSRCFAVDARLDEQFDASEKLAKVWQFCKDRFQRNAHKQDRSLLPLFELTVQGFTPKECAEKLGVTQSTISNWLRVLQGAAA